MMTRKVFQELQLSSVKVKEPSKMSREIASEAVDGNVNIKSKKLSTVPAKRSKLKNRGNENKTKKSSKEVKKKAGFKAKVCAQKEETLQDIDLSTTVILNQSRLESYLLPCSSTAEISDDSALGNSTVSKSITEELNLLTSEKTSLAYWQEIAEQRRIAIEKTIVENEMLADEISVLQTENLQLKNALEAAETLLKHVGVLD